MGGNPKPLWLAGVHITGVLVTLVAVMLVVSNFKRFFTQHISSLFTSTSNSANPPSLPDFDSDEIKYTGKRRSYVIAVTDEAERECLKIYARYIVTNFVLFSRLQKNRNELIPGCNYDIIVICDGGDRWKGFSVSALSETLAKETDPFLSKTNASPLELYVIKTLIFDIDAIEWNFSNTLPIPIQEVHEKSKSQ